MGHAQQESGRVLQIIRPLKMATQPRDYVAGSSSLVMGCDSYTSPAELGDTEYLFGQNVVCRGGILQTRPGSRSLFCLPDGNFQGMTLFTPDNGVAQIVAAVDGKIYVSAAPFTSYRRLWNLQFSPSAKYIAWASCLKSTDYDNAGDLVTLDTPYSVLMMQDGLTRAAYWDGGNSAHINPGPPPFPNAAENLPGYSGTPIGLWMIWSGNRLWVSRQNQVFASDIGNPLKFTESTYLNEARAFYLTGPCTGFVATPDQQGIIAFTETNGTFFQSVIQQRTDWLNTPDFQKIILPNIGNVAPRSLITQYGLNWWFSARGLTNFNAALRTNVTSRIDYQDNQMFSSKAYLGPDLSSICSGFYENYLMCSVPSGDVRNRHTWVLDQAPFEGNANAWDGIWTGWRPIEWTKGIVNGNERVFFGSIDYDGKNRIWEAMLADKTDNGCAITCYAQLRDHAAGNLDQKRYEWTKFFLSQIYGEVDLNVYVASTKGGYQLQKGYHLVANEGQVFADVAYSEEGPLMIGNRVQSRVIRTPSDPDDDECNSCGVESKEGNKIDYAFSHLLVWSGQMGIRAYQMHMRESPDRDAGDCEEAEVGPRTLNAQGCSGLELLVDTGIFELFEATAEGATVTREGGSVYIRQTVESPISEDNAQALAECRVQQIINALKGQTVPVGVYNSGSAEMGTNTSFVVVEGPITPPASIAEVTFESEQGTATLCGYSEYTSPSTPPKKYRKKTQSGIIHRCVYSDPAATVFVQSDYYDIAGEANINAATCGETDSRTYQYFKNLISCAQGILDGSGASTGFGCNFQNDYCDLTPTTKDLENPGTIFPSVGLYFRMQSVTAQEILSIEDTESDAIARSTPTPGASPISYLESRGAADFTFLWQNSIAIVGLVGLVVGESYEIGVGLLVEDYGGGNAVTTETTVTFVASSSVQAVNVPIPVASGKQATAINWRVNHV